MHTAACRGRSVVATLPQGLLRSSAGSPGPTPPRPAGPARRRWDAGEHLLICYAFKDAPDLSVVPAEAEEDSEAESLDEEERDTFRRRGSPPLW